MNHQEKLKRELCLGNLIWMQPPGGGSAVFFAKKLLNTIGYVDRELLFLTARQFMRYCMLGFSKEFLQSCRVILIGGMDDLPLQNRRELLKRLSFYKTMKLKFEVSLILISPAYLDIADELHRALKPSVFRIFDEGDPIGINEKIHHYIERASEECGNSIWRLSPQAAESLEVTLLLKGEDYLKQILRYAVQYVSDKQLKQEDLDRARQYIESFQVNVNLSS